MASNRGRRMIDIIFNNQSTAKSVTFSRINEHVVSLVGITEQNTSGFKTYRLNGQSLGDFSDYTTIYRVLDDEVRFSNDGSVYVPPVEPTPEEIETQKRMSRVVELKQKLASYDYIGVKIATGCATIEDYAEQIAEMQAWRAEINELENKDGH